MPEPELLISARRCSQCLTTRNRIVSGARAAEIIRECRATDTHFLCHKAPEGEIWHCRGVFEILGPSRAYRMAVAFKFPIVEVDADDQGRRG